LAPFCSEKFHNRYIAENDPIGNENEYNTLVLGVSLAVVAGLFGSSTFDITGMKSDAQTSAAANGVITGHVTTTVTDSEGNIKAYRQSDNLIVNNGENCVSKMLFKGGGATGTGVCTGANTAGFNFVAIGNGTNAAADANIRLQTIQIEPGLSTPLQGTTTLTNASGTTPASALISATFTNNGGPTTVRESGLFNGTNMGTSGMFARQVFTAINMNNGDSLTVQWTVNIGGTTTFN